MSITSFSDANPHTVKSKDVTNTSRLQIKDTEDLEKKLQRVGGGSEGAL